MGQESPIRVLQVTPSLNRSAGVASVVYNWHRFHDEERVHFDYLHHSSRDGVLMHDNRYDEKLVADGSKVYTVNYASDGFRRFSQELHETLADIGSQYDIVHCHMPNSAFIVLKDAKRFGVQHRILHSHLNNSSDKFLHRLRNMPLNAIGKHYATDRIACSQEAGQYLFGSRPFTVLNNGIPLEQFSFDVHSKNSLRAELGIASEDPVIGCVGRFVKQKNFTFAIQVFARLRKQLPNAKLLILGDGDDRKELERTILDEGVADSVLLLGIRNDAESLYSVMDVFFMPSLYEGLPVSAVEAQAAGLPCVYSTSVPHETDITETGVFASLDAGLDAWTEVLVKAIETHRLLENPAVLEKRGYSAKANAELLMRHYEHLVGIGKE